MQPQNWPVLPLSEVCEVNPRLPRNHGIADGTAVSFVPMAAVDETAGRISNQQVRRFAEVKKGYTHFEDEDVLFAKITPCMENGKAAIARNLINGHGFGSTEFHVLRPKSGVLPEWVFYFMRRSSFRDEAKRKFTGTAGQQRVQTSFMERIKLPVPPLTEQCRIVDILSRAEGIVRLRREAQKKAAEIIPALFLDMFGDPATNPNGWQDVSLGSVIEEFRYGTSQKSGPAGYPTLRIPNVTGDRLDPTEIKLVTASDTEVERLRLREGDLLFVRTNGNPDYVGRSAVFNAETMRGAGFDPVNCLYASYLIRGRIIREAISPHYLQAFLSSAEGRRRLKERCRTSAGQYNINIGGLSSVVVPLPPLHRQFAFEHRCSDVFSIQSQQTYATEKAEATFEELLDHTFRNTVTTNRG